jgi:hypothetical protein
MKQCRRKKGNIEREIASYLKLYWNSNRNQICFWCSWSILRDIIFIVVISIFFFLPMIIRSSLSFMIPMKEKENCPSDHLLGFFSNNPKEISLRLILKNIWKKKILIDICWFYRYWQQEFLFLQLFDWIRKSYSFIQSSFDERGFIEKNIFVCTIKVFDSK